MLREGALQHWSVVYFLEHRYHVNEPVNIDPENGGYRWPLVVCTSTEKTLLKGTHRGHEQILQSALYSARKPRSTRPEARTASGKKQCAGGKEASGKKQGFQIGACVSCRVLACAHPPITHTSPTEPNCLVLCIGSLKDSGSSSSPVSRHLLRLVQ